MSRTSKVRSRLAVRYFDDRILLTDNVGMGVLPAADGVVRVHHRRGARGARHQHHDRDGRHPHAGRRDPPADRAPHVPGGRVGAGAGRDLRRRARLARLPRGDVRPRVGEGLLDQGGLPRRTPRPPWRRRAAVRRSVPPAVRPLQAQRGGTRAARRRDPGKGDRALDRAGRAPRPGAQRQRPVRAARDVDRGRVAVPARRERLADRPAAIGHARGARGARARSRPWSRARSSTAGPTCGSSSRTARPTPRTSRSRGSRT